MNNNINLTKSKIALLFISLFATNTYAGTDIVADGGFEGGFPNADWTPTSTFTGLNGFPFCGADNSCPVPPADVGTGNWVIWIGGLAGVTSSVEQTITIPASAGELSLTILRGICDDIGDVLHISIDATDIGTLPCDDTDATPVLHSFPTTGFNDDGSHLLKIEGSFPGTNGAHSNFFIDDVTIDNSVPVELMNYSVE